MFQFCDGWQAETAGCRHPSLPPTCDRGERKCRRLTLAGLLALRRYRRERTEPALASAALGVMAVVLFCIVGHVWPWFVVWLVSIAACACWSFLAVLVMLFASAAPLLDLAWLLRDDMSLLAPLGLLVYALALCGTLLLRAQRHASITEATSSGTGAGAVARNDARTG